MFLQLEHEKLDIYKVARSFVHACYRLSKMLPPDERFAMTQQLRRAALSVHLNVAEGCSRKSPNERKRFYEISRGSLIEIDAIFDVMSDLNYATRNDMEEAGQLMTRCFKMLSRMMN